jgi:hypothetical protein
MSAIAAQLAEELSTIRRPGDFFTLGTAEILAPRLEVDGVGVVALPLLPSTMLHPIVLPPVFTRHRRDWLRCAITIHPLG